MAAYLIAQLGKNYNNGAMMVTTDAEESNEIIFQSKDNGATWEYSGNTQKMN